MQLILKVGALYPRLNNNTEISLENGTLPLAFRDVSAKIRPETALLRSITSPNGLKVLEQNFDFDLLTPQKLLEKYVGRTVKVTVQEPLPGDWQILSESHPHTKTDSQTAVWKVTIPAESSTTLTYRSRVRL